MQKSLGRKGLVLGIIVLFVGASVTPSISGNIDNINTKGRSSTMNVLEYDPESGNDDIKCLNSNRDVLFYDDFDDGDISDWTVTTAGNGVFEASTNKSVSSPYSVHMKSLNKFDQAMGMSPSYSLNLSVDYEVSFYFLIPSTNNHWFEVFNNNQTYLVISSGTQLRWYNGSSSYSIMSLNTDHWYHIELKIDSSSDTYDVYIDSDYKTTCDMWIHTGFEDDFRIGDRNNDQGSYFDYGEAYWDDFNINQTYPVHNLDTGEGFLTIQAAIDDPDTLNGHTIEVSNGTYYENVIVNKTISLTGQDRNGTIIDGSGSGDVVKITADYVNISGVKINNSGNNYFDACIKIVSSYNSINGNIIVNYHDSGHDYCGIWVGSSHNYIIGNIIQYGDHAIFLESSYTTIKENNISHADMFISSSYNTIESNIYSSIRLDSLADRNNVSNNTGGCIYMVNYCNYNNIFNNTIKARIGIDLAHGASGGNHNYNNIFNNKIDCDNQSQSRGIGIWADSDHNTIKNNIINNANSGIYLTCSSSDSCDHNIITGNTITNSYYYAIIMHSFSWMEGNNTILNNFISDSGLAIYILGSNGNIIYHNNFINNTNQALDYGNNNTWDNGYPSGGNYWSDFDESSEGAYDNDSDGIVDSPYNISGGSNQDMYPLMTQHGPPYAEFTFSVDNFTCSFNASNSYDYDGYITLYHWDFDDTTSGTGLIINHTYVDYGTYSVTLMVTDDDGKNNSISIDVLIGALTYHIPLNTGWDLISVPVDIDMMASNLAENITGSIMVSRFDAENQTYRTYIVGGPPGFDFLIEDGYGYFVLVDQNSTLSLSGYRIDSVSVSLSVDWNMIGWYHTYNTTASSLGENITGCQMVSKFDAVNQTFKTYIVGGPPGFDFTVTPGMGLFALVDTASTWHGEG